MHEDVGVARALGEPRKLAAGGNIGHDQPRSVVAVVAGDDKVGDVRRAMGDEPEPEGPTLTQRRSRA